MALGLHGVQYEKVNEHVGSVAREGKRNERNGHSRGDLGGLGNRLRQNHRVKRRQASAHDDSSKDCQPVQSIEVSNSTPSPVVARRRPKNRFAINQQPAGLGVEIGAENRHTG